MGILYDKVKAGSLGGSSNGGSLYERAQKKSLGIQTETPITAEEPKMASQPSIFSKTADSLKGVAMGEVNPTEVIKGIPEAAKNVGVGFAKTFIPAVSNFVKTTGSIFGEGMAYAIDPEVRKQYTNVDTSGIDTITNAILEKRQRGEDTSRLVEQLRNFDSTEQNNLDILPVVTDTTQAKIVKATLAAGIETAIFKAMPSTLKMNWKARGGIGTLQGLGFAVSEGLAKDKSAEEIMDSLPEYGILGGAVEIAAPWLLPLLRTEINRMPKNLKNVFKGVEEEAASAATRKLDIAADAAENRIPISTPNSRYEAYLRSQGYEPYIPESKLPTIEMGNRPKIKDDLPTIQFGDEIPPAKRVKGDFEFVPEKGFRIGEKGNYFSTSKEYPLQGGFKGELREVNLPPDAKLLDAKDYKNFDELLTADERQILSKANSSEINRIQQNVLERNGYDGMKILDEGSNGKTYETIFLNDKKSPDFNFTETRTTKVSREQLPVNTEEGQIRVSRLEARVKNKLDSVNPARAEAEGISTYKQMNKADQINRASKFAEENPEEAMAVLRGEKPAPDGLLHNSIAIAMEEKAASAADANLAMKLASLRSTRAGQEISILTEADPTNAISQIQEIIKARAGRASKVIQGGDVQRAIKSEVAMGSEVIKQSRLKIEEAESLLERILC